MTRHHGNHRGLLAHIPAGAIDRERHTAREGRIDAVIVPSARGARYLTEAARVAAGLRCPLLTLCSKNTHASEAEQLARTCEADVTVIDFSSDGLVPLEHDTTRLLRTHGFLYDVDTSLKRNVGLAIAQRCGWRRVVLLDDDVEVPELSAVRTAAAWLDRYGAVGMDNLGFRDNSVVCHAYRELPGRANQQQQFISTMALAIDPVGTHSFFPHVYNEDWLYLIGDDVRLKQLAVTGHVRQAVYDPFRRPERAAREELGDTIAEGLFWLLDNGRGPDEADAQFWDTYIPVRRSFIEGVLAEYRASDSSEERHAEALDAALRVNEQIDPMLCGEFVRLWREDLQEWSKQSTERVSSPPVALDVAVKEVLDAIPAWRL